MRNYTKRLLRVSHEFSRSVVTLNGQFKAGYILYPVFYPAVLLSIMGLATELEQLTQEQERKQEEFVRLVNWYKEEYKDD